MNCRRLTDVNSLYYRLSPMRTLQSLMRTLQTFFTCLESTCTYFRYLFLIHCKRACLQDKGNFLLLLKGKKSRVIMSFFLYNCEIKVMVTRSFSLISHLLEIHKALKVHLIYFLFLRCLGHMLAQSNVLCINQDSTSTIDMIT